MDPAARPEISVVIPCRGHAEELRVCLAGLRAQHAAPPFEVVVVDSGEGAAVAEVVRTEPGVRLVRSPTPLGPGPARNLGAASTRAPLLAFLDADCAAEPGWLRAIHGALAKPPAGAGGPVLDLLPWHPIAAADNFLQFYDLRPHRRPGSVAYLPGCNLAIDRESFEALGGFPDATPGQDVLFTRAAARLLPQGLRFEPTLRVRHHGRTRLGAFLRHHRAFGRARGRHALMARPLEQRMAHRSAWLPMLVAKRLAYMGVRSALHSPLGLLRFVLLSPLLLPGTCAWALGVREGSRERRRVADGAAAVAAAPREIGVRR